MVKLRLPRIVLSAPRLLTVAVLAGLTIAGVGYGAVRQLSAPPSGMPTDSAKQGTTPTAAPQPTTAAQTPAAAAPTAPTPATSKLPATTTVAHSPTPAPVVTPSGNANVNGLAPVDPTPMPSDGSSGSSSGGSTTPPDDSNSAPPQQTTGYTSTNWSGYLATGDHYTAVSGSWTVPVATGVAGKTSADTAWVGIGGVTTNDLIQTGTLDSVSPSGHETVQAFYELLPRSAHIISSLTVAPGDVMSATITETSANNWHVTLNDLTSGDSYSTDLAYASALSSAEWIQEDPSQSIGGVTTLVPLDGFAPVHFTGGTTATTAAGTLTIAASNALPVTLVAAHGGSVLAVPTALGSDGKSFTVSRTSQQ